MNFDFKMVFSRTYLPLSLSVRPRTNHQLQGCENISDKFISTVLTSHPWLYNQGWLVSCDWWHPVCMDLLVDSTGIGDDAWVPTLLRATCPGTEARTTVSPPPVQAAPPTGHPLPLSSMSVLEKKGVMCKICCSNK